MAVRVRRLHPVFVGEVTGVDLGQPVDAATFAAIEAAIHRHGVLVFPDQRITDAQQLA
ncbi:MAG: TauD/TfdA family dioxygenase, partial [Proteobacteria bacterium]|nr:TauD/TfdA family dioxygenase [Pseudomonadota bacterium]